MNEGYLLIHRKIMSWEWYTDIVVKTVFFHCLLRANYQDAVWHGVSLKRGQFITSYRHLAEECGITTKQARRAIWALSRTHEIEYKGQGKYSVVTVVKYNQYQIKGTQMGTQMGNERASKGQQIININKNNKHNEYKKENASDDDYVTEEQIRSDTDDDDWLRSDR